jgi:hypothetical protein
MIPYHRYEFRTRENFLHTECMNCEGVILDLGLKIIIMCTCRFVELNKDQWEASLFLEVDCSYE